MYKVEVMICFLIQGFFAVGWPNFSAFCEHAAEDDQVFASFKRNKTYQDVLEHVTYQQGFNYLRFIVDHYPDLVPHFNLFKENDRLGNPLVYNFRRYGTFSPTTLRYICVAGDLLEKFGSLERLHILEIGGGYGGQCKILAMLGGWASYTILDLPGVTALTKTYLARNNVSNVETVDSTDLSRLRDQYDLLISNYGYLEFGRETQERYYPVMKSARMGYIIGNFPPHAHYISREELVDFFAQNGIELSFQGEKPLSAPDNWLITWGIDP